MANAKVATTRSYHCPGCESYYWGDAVEKRYTEDYVEEDTAEDAIDWYHATRGSACGCDDDDIDGEFENYSETWQCSTCGRIFGDDMPSAWNCCTGGEYRLFDHKLRALPGPQLAAERLKVK